jgi:hypothetical protein
MKKLTELSDDELKQLQHKVSNRVSELDTKQYAVKISLNSLYGALGNQYFRYFDIRMAEAVTITGQFVIRYLEEGLNTFLNDALETEDESYVIAGDTDSVIGSSKIVVNGIEQTIEEFFDAQAETSYLKYDEFNNQFVKKVENCTTKSVSKNKHVEEKSVSYVMKHEVEKEMFKITVNGKSVIVTEDHSVMIFRDGKLRSCKAKDIKSEDKLISKK